MEDRTKPRPGSASYWLFPAGRVAFYFQTAGFLKSDQWLFCTGFCTQVHGGSIHAPAWGATVCTRSATSVSPFQSTPPRGGRRKEAPTASECCAARCFVRSGSGRSEYDRYVPALRQGRCAPDPRQANPATANWTSPPVAVPTALLSAFRWIGVAAGAPRLTGRRPAAQRAVGRRTGPVQCRDRVAVRVTTWCG